MIVIDPRYTDTAAGREDEWIPIRPGTDAALVAGIARVLITEELVDQPFLDKYCIGYDEKTLPVDAPANGHYKAYIMGDGDDSIAKHQNGHRTSPGSQPRALLNWPERLVAPNRRTSVRDGATAPCKR